MTHDRRKMISIILKCLFVLASISILFSIYWLRPLMNEGSRYTMTFIQRMQPFWDNANLRFLLVPFQMPALIAIKSFPEISPLFVARIYFYTIYIPIIFTLGYLFLKLKEEKEIFIGAFIFFIVFLPGMNFQLSHINETLVIFILALICGYKQRPILFTLLSFLAILGHPAIMGPFILLSIFFLTEIFYFKRKGFWKFLIINSLMIWILFTKTKFTLSVFPGLSGIYVETFSRYFAGITLSHHDFVSAIFLMILGIVVEYFPGPKRISQFVWSLIILMMVFFIFREDARELGHLSYQYRVFSISFFCLVLIYGWALLRLNWKPVSSPLAYVFLIFLASWFTVRDMRSALWFWKVAPAIVSKDYGPGCHYTNEHTSFIYSSLPVLKIFIENKRVVDSVLYSTHYDPEKRLCPAFSGEGLPIQILRDGRIFSYSIRSEGFFTISPMTRKD